MSYNLILNSKNLVTSTQFNNVYQYNFPSGSFTIPEGSEMSINQVTIPYSWRNVSAALGNNTFSYYLPNSSNVQTAYTVTLADGFYTITDIQSALQATMKTNGHYWYDTQAAYSQQFQFTGVITGANTLTIDAGYKQVQLNIGYVISYIPVGSTSYTTATVTALTATSGVYTVSGATNTISTGMVSQLGSEITPSIIYPITLTSSPVLYTNTITSQTIPTVTNIPSVFGAGWINANGQNGQPSWTGGYPTSGNQYASLTFPTTTSTTQTIANILGFTSAGLGTTFYPPQTTTTALQTVANGNSLSAQPPFPPKGTIVNGVIVRCNLVYNNVSIYNDVLDTFPITSTYGSNINYLPISDNFVRIKGGKYSSFTITFNDDNFNNLAILDPTVLIGLIIRFPQ